MSTVQLNRVCLLAKLTKKSNNQFLNVLMYLLKLKQLKEKKSILKNYLVI
jgi:hypothetical protein